VAPANGRAAGDGALEVRVEHAPDFDRQVAALLLLLERHAARAQAAPPRAPDAANDSAPRPAAGKVGRRREPANEPVREGAPDGR
jgi:hypothetical protein